MRFAGRNVLISGAGGGIGSALVHRFQAEGADVLGVDRNAAALDTLPGQTHLMDVSSEAACADLAQMVNARWGGLDVLVNNAGWFPVRAFADMTYAEWREVIAINLDSVFLMTKSLLPMMRRRGAGRIINIGSGSVYKGPARQAHYVAAKAGVVGLSRCLANEVGGDGITVNVVAPGLTATPGAEFVFTAGEMQARAQTRPIKRVQTADDVVGAVMFLASDDAAFITGTTMSVDGGTTMR